FIWSALLLLSLGWALYDEVYGIRPWKSIQARFAKVYTRYLRSVGPHEATFENQVKASAEYKKLDGEMLAAEKAVSAKVAEIDHEVNQVLVPRILALNDPFQEVRSHIGALTYQIETTEKVKMTFDDMDRTLVEWKNRKAQRLQERVNILKPATELRAQRDKYLSDRIADVSADTLAGLVKKMADFDI